MKRVEDTLEEKYIELPQNTSKNQDIHNGYTKQNFRDKLNILKTKKRNMHLVGEDAQRPDDKFIQNEAKSIKNMLIKNRHLQSILNITNMHNKC